MTLGSLLALNSNNPLYFKEVVNTNLVNMRTGVERKGNEKKARNSYT